MTRRSWNRCSRGRAGSILRSPGSGDTNLLMGTLTHSFVSSSPYLGRGRSTLRSGVTVCGLTRSATGSATVAGTRDSTAMDRSRSFSSALLGRPSL